MSSGGDLCNAASFVRRRWTPARASAALVVAPNRPAQLIAQRQAREAYEVFKENPHHGSLQFKRINTKEPPIYSVRVGAHYLAVGTLRGDRVVWFWIGTHETYNKLRFS